VIKEELCAGVNAPRGPPTGGAVFGVAVLRGEDIDAMGQADEVSELVNSFHKSRGTEFIGAERWSETRLRGSWWARIEIRQKSKIGSKNC